MKWTPDKIEDLKSLWGKIPRVKIAKHFGVTENSIIGAASRNNIQYHGDPALVVGLKPDSAALVEARTVYPASVVRPREGDPILVPGQYNRKIGGQINVGPWKGMPIYTLTLEERATCPKSCHEWATCYGNGMHAAKRIDHKGRFFNILLADQICKLTYKHEKYAIRLHVLGDFYSLEYVDLWNWALKNHKGLHVFGFTARKSSSKIGKAVAYLNRKFPDRFRVRFSVPMESSGPFTAVTTREKPVGAKSSSGYICPVARGKLPSCGDCGLCWHPNFDRRAVVFPLHGKQKRK